MLNGLGLFEGISGITLGLEWSGLCTPMCFVEKNPYAQETLKLRYPEVPIWDDVTTFDGKPWKGKIDIISGGFPCQDISVAGKGVGIEGSRSGLWSEFKRIIDEIRPLFTIIENVPALLIRGFGTVLSDLCEIGYSSEWFVLSAADMGAPHLRKRMFVVAYPRHRSGRNIGITKTRKEPKTRRTTNTNKTCGSGKQPTPLADSESTNDRRRNTGKVQRQKQESRNGGRKGDISYTERINDDNRRHGTSKICGKRSEPTTIQRSTEKIPNTPIKGLEGEKPEGWAGRKSGLSAECSQWTTEPNVGRVAHGIPSRVDRLKSLGNAVVPQCAEYIGRLIMKAING